MTRRNRREFCADVGRGMLIASVGAGLAADLGLGTVSAEEAPKELSFGKLEPLVCLMQETPAEKLLPLLVQRLRDGADLKQLVAAAALANARTFGGEDYVGFHTLMALAPAFAMSGLLPEGERPLPVFKVLYRNTNRIQQQGGRKNEVLHPVAPGELPEGKRGGEALLEAVRRKDADRAERTFAALMGKGPEAALDELLVMVQDAHEVHRTVLPYRAWDLLPLIGREHAHTMLRQSVRFCVKSESPRYSGYFSGARALLPKLLERHKLPRAGRTGPPREATDAWVERMSETIFKGTPEQAAEAVAAALAEGFAPDALGEAVSLAVNQLVLRDNGRPQREVQPGKPLGSCHGDSIGVHACDSANAWRNMARVAGPRNRAACLILSAYQAASDRGNRGGDFLKWEPYPRADARERVNTDDPAKLLKLAEDAIRNKDQALASAAVAAYEQKGREARPVFELLLSYAVSEDGALHAEKYYRTVAEEFVATRPAFRWRQLVALARVTASAFGQPAPRSGLLRDEEKSMIPQRCPGPIDRRAFLRAGGLALGGLGLPGLFAGRAAAGTASTDTSVILVYCLGGASHLETYDLKPDGPSEMRSVFRPIPTRVPGMSVCELFPLHARVADRFSLVRSLHHKVNIHNDGSITVLTGKEPTVLDPTSQARSEHPDFGMIAARLRGPHRDALPQYVSVPSAFHMTRPNYLGAAHQAFATGDVSRPGYAPPLLRLRGTGAGLDDRLRLLGQLDRARRDLDRSAQGDAMDRFRRQAYDVLTNPAVARAFDLDREPARLRDRYGRHLWGQACLLARRLAEAGTAVVSVVANTPKNGREFTNWDDHPGNAMRPGHFAQYMRTRLPYFDQAVSSLIEDIFDRGLSRKVLLVVVGEFGRTPRLRVGPPDRAIGRDHWPDAYSALVSGGGLRMGQVVGATNARGEHPTEAPLTPQDLLATVYHHLGIDPGHVFTDYTGRPVPVLHEGKPIRQLV